MKLLAATHRSAALAQLVCRIQEVVRYGSGHDIFGAVRASFLK